MVVLWVATLWVTAKNAPFSDRNKSFQTFLKTFEIASQIRFFNASATRSTGSPMILEMDPSTD